jgi:hypothetical protein
MSTALRIRQALPLAPPWALTVLLAACGGGMGSDMTSMGTGAMSSGSMSGGSMDMNCMGMGGMSMSCPAPSVALVAPPGTVSRTVTLRAHVSVSGGDVMARVDFMVDGTRIGSVNAAPFSVSWDSTSVSDGPHTLTATASDSMGQVGNANPVAIAVDNHPAFTVTLTPAQIFPTPESAASGVAHLQVDLATGGVSGRVALNGVTATAVTLNEAFAGDRGALRLALRPGASSSEWDLPAGAMLTEEQTTSLLQGGLYLSVASGANPQGELRGQITPANIMVTFSPMSGTQEVPPVMINAAGNAATTVDRAANTLTVHVHATGVDDAMAGEVAVAAAGATGARLAALSRDDVDPGHWSAQLVVVGAADMTAFNASHWYINLLTPADPQGAIRGQVELSAH